MSDLSIAQPTITSDVIELHANQSINSLDVNFTLDNLAQVLKDMTDMTDNIIWIGGDLLVYGRMRMDKHLVWANQIQNGNDNIIFNQAMAWAEEKYTKQKMVRQPVFLVSWKIYMYPAYWILVSPDDIRVWSTETERLGEQGFNDWLQDTARYCRPHWKTLAAHYRTSATWHRPWDNMIGGRRYEVPWSVHAEIGNYIGGAIDLSFGGVEGLVGRQTESFQVMQYLDKEDQLNVAAVIKLKDQRDFQVQGYKFVAPVTEGVFIEDKSGGKTHQIIQFSKLGSGAEFDTEMFYAQQMVQRFAGIFKGPMNIGNKTIILKSDNLQLEDGKIIGWLINRETDAVEKAQYKLALIMNWVIDST